MSGYKKMSSNYPNERPTPEDAETYQEFYNEVFEWLIEVAEDVEGTPELHIDEGNELVRICPHCEAPAIISISSMPSEPAWRCVGATGVSDRHSFTRSNIPDERVHTDPQMSAD